MDPLGVFFTPALLSLLPDLGLFATVLGAAIFRDHRASGADRYLILGLVLVLAVPAVMMSSLSLVVLFLLLVDLMLGVSPVGRAIEKRVPKKPHPDLDQHVEQAEDLIRQLEDLEKTKSELGEVMGVSEQLEKEVVAVVKAADAAQDALWRRLAPFLVLLALIQIWNAASDTPWLPPEVLTRDVGDRFTGYVLAETRTETLILIDNDRSVRRLPTTSIRDREYCSSEESGTALGPSLGRILFNETRYERCP